MSVAVIGNEVAARVSNPDQTLRRLRALLERHHRRRHTGGNERAVVPTGLAPLDAALPGGGLPRGTLTEILTAGPGVGAWALALRIAGRHLLDPNADTSRPATAEPNGFPKAPPRRKQESEEGGMAKPRCAETPPCSFPIEHTTATGACRRSPVASLGMPPVAGKRFAHTATDMPGAGLGRSRVAGIGNAESAFSQRWSPVVIVDTERDFYPPAAVDYGVPLERLIVLRVRDAAEVLWATEQALSCCGVAGVIAPLAGLDERQSRRLQLAVEQGRGLGLILAPAGNRARSFAATRLLVEGAVENPGAKDLGWEDRGVSDKTPLSLGGEGRVRAKDVPRPPPSPLPLFLEGRGVEAGTLTSMAGVASSCSRSQFGGCGYLCRITLLTVREGRPAAPFWVDLHHETGTVPLPALARPRTASRSG